jgi:hypothetical protein
MSLTLKQTTEDFPILPEGQYIARCFKVIDLGTQTIEWNGEEKLQPKVMVSWEVLEDTSGNKPMMNDGRPFAISKTYTASLSERANLYQDLVAWRGRAFTNEELLGFDISKLLGAYCQIQVIHSKGKDRTYANINTIMATKDKPKGVNPIIMFDINNPDMDVFNSFSDYLKDKIRSSQEWQNKDKDEEPVEQRDVVIEDLGDEDPPDVSGIPF